MKTKQGNNFSLILLLVPLAGMICAFSIGLQFPSDISDFLTKSLVVLFISYFIFWWLSFWKVRQAKNIQVASFLLFWLWMLGGVMGLAFINVHFDKSQGQQHQAIILEAKKLGGRGISHSKAVCGLTLESHDQKFQNVSIEYSQCDKVIPHQSVLNFEVKDGSLGFPWISKWSLE